MKIVWLFVTAMFCSIDICGASASTVVPQSLEAILCQADAIVVARVIKAAAPQRLDRDEKKEPLSKCDIYLWQYTYRVQPSKTLWGNLKLKDTNVTFLDRSSMKCSFTTPASGIEAMLNTDAEYLLLLTRGNGNDFSLLRAEPLQLQQRVVEMLSDGHCSKKGV